MATVLIGDLTEIRVGRGLTPEMLPTRSDRRRVALLYQPSVRSVMEAVASLVVEAVEVVPIELPDREEAKSLSTLEAVYGQLAEARLGRGDTIVGVGGGAATDLAGFVAATWLRGVESVLVPTTLLGAVDAAIGGKTAVNLAGKNLVGAFWHPARVHVDLDILDSLPSDLLVEGSAEVLKAGYLGSPEIVAAYQRHGRQAPLDQVVEPAIGIKAAIVTDDLTENGRRVLLNLGHTVGHAVEFAAAIPHGHAVAIGLVAAAAVSESRLGFDGRQELVDLLTRMGLPTSAPPVDRSLVEALLALDKKHDHEGLRMVLLRRAGEPEVHHVGRPEVELGLAAIGL